MSTPEVAKPVTTSKAPEVKSNFTAEDIAKIVSDTAVAVAAAMKSGSSQQMTPAPSVGRQSHDPGPRCMVCGQYVTGCHNEHVEAVVYPDRYTEFGDFFQGVTLNGVRYLSNNENHEIPIPKEAAPHILSAVRGFELNERETRNGRRAEHNSGSIHNPLPATVGWR